MSYSNVNIKEGANMELTKNLVKNIKLLDSELAVKRLIGLINSHKNNPTFTEIAGEFNSLVGHETAEDA